MTYYTNQHFTYSLPLLLPSSSATIPKPKSRTPNSTNWILQVLYKFRFGTSNLLACTGTSQYQCTSKNYGTGIIGRDLNNSYITHRPPLTTIPKAIRLLKQLRAWFKGLHLLYHNAELNRILSAIVRLSGYIWARWIVWHSWNSLPAQISWTKTIPASAADGYLSFSGKYG